MSESPRKAERTLTDGSRLELTWTGAPDTSEGSAPDLEALADLMRMHAEAERLPKPALAAAQRGLVGKSPSVQALIKMIAKVAPTQATVLITGENGTGKELVARAIHEGSPRAGKPFVAANVSAFNDNLLESELFGHKRGAFTGAVSDKRGLFEEADGGTFLLDEVGDMSPALQAKLLRVLQEGTFMQVGGTQTKKVDVRIIAATNRDLAAMVKKGTFREDLYYRLHVVALRTPPLRERGSDLDLLVDHFFARLSEKHKRDKRLSPEAREALRLHTWPGNVRELQNEAERIWVLSGDEPIIQLEHLSRPIAQNYARHKQASAETTPDASDAPATGLAQDEPLTQVLARVERQTIERVLARVSGDHARAAQLLGLSRRNLAKKLELLGLATPGEAS